MSEIYFIDSAFEDSIQFLLNFLVVFLIFVIVLRIAKHRNNNTSNESQKNMY